MQLNLDVWHEVISYLQYPEDVHTLRSLALTSKMPSNLALDAIWQNGENFLTIISVINFFAASPDQPFLEYRPNIVTDADDWVLHGPLPCATRLRALEYLTRIRNLRVVRSWPTSKEDLLFSLLPTCLECTGPLFPYLRHLEIYDDAHDVRNARIDCLTPIISPSLKTLEIYAEHFPEDTLMLPILELARERGCDLEVFTYDRSPVERAPEVLAFFTTLQDVNITQNYPLQHGSSITIVKFLASLPSLRSLSCNPNLFLPSTTEETFNHNGLQKMHIVSSPTALRELFRRCIFPSAIELRVEKCIKIPNFDDLGPSSPGFEGLDKSYPNVQKLHLCVHPICNEDISPAFDFEHFAPLLSLPMQTFELAVAKLDLTPSDLRTISESWSNLHSFKIWSVTTFEFTALSSLAAFSNHPQLTDLDLNTRPPFLLDNVTEVPDLIVAHTPTPSARSNPCTLYFATIGSPQEIPFVTKAEKHSLVEYLLSVFPDLKLESKHRHIQGAFSNPDGEVLVELQGILSELRKARGESDGLV